MRVESFIIQVSAEEDRGPQESAAAAEGLIPIVVFANGPENAFLVRALADDVDAALDAAWDRLDEPKAQKEDHRAGLFRAMAHAVESGFSGPSSETDFPNFAMALFAEALAQYGVDSSEELAPCAVRFAEDELTAPDYEEAG